MDLSIIIVSYNTKDILKECVERIMTSDDRLEKEIIVVDNASSDGSCGMIKANFPGVILIKNEKNIGFAKANNQAAGIAKGRFSLLLNPDAFIEKGTIPKTVNFMEQNTKCGILGCRVVDRSGKLQPSARYFPTPWKLFLEYSGISARFSHGSLLRGIDDMKWNHKSVREVDWVPGCYFLVRKTVIDKIGFFDERFYLYKEDVDFCFRAKKNNWKIFFYPDAQVVHLKGESATTVGAIMSRGRQIENLKFESEFLYFRKHYSIAYVLLDFFFICLLDMIEILKKMVWDRKEIDTKEKIRHMSMAWSNLVSTKFGSRSGTMPA